MGVEPTLFHTRSYNAGPHTTKARVRAAWRISHQQIELLQTPCSVSLYHDQCIDGGRTATARSKAAWRICHQQIKLLQTPCSVSLHHDPCIDRGRTATARLKAAWRICHQEMVALALRVDGQQVERAAQAVRQLRLAQAPRPLPPAQAPLQPPVVAHHLRVRGTSAC